MKHTKKARATRAQGKKSARRLTKNNLDVQIQFVEENPKRPGSESHSRYALYQPATTVREALYLGATKGDLHFDEKFGFLRRVKDRSAGKPKEKKQKNKVMRGLVLDGNRYISEREYLGLGIQARKHTTIEEAEKSLKAIDRMLADVQLRIDQKIMAGKENSLQDFVGYVKAAVTAEQKASPELGVEGWRFYSRNRICMLTKAALKQICKDPRISKGIKYIRVLQDSIDNALPGWVKLSKAAGLNQLSDIVGVDGLKPGRRSADEFAKKALKSLKRKESPSDDVVLKALRLWGFGKSVSRQNVMPEGHTWVHSDTLGIIEARSDHSMMVSSPCQGHENFVRLLCSWARRRSPNGALPFTTISLNKNYAGRMHRDGGNIGPSIGLAIGNFTKGRLRYWAGDSQKGRRSATVEQVRDEPSIALNTRNGAVFDGNCAHEVEPFKGERYSLIFFTVKKYQKTSDEVKRKMVSMGADWPTSSSLQRLREHVPT